MMDFFEALSKRAHNKVDVDEKRYGSPPFEFALTGYGGIKATIEALKEMMVGDLLECDIEHNIDKKTYPGEEMPVTNLYWGDGAMPWIEGHRGTDGEQAVMIVFRIPKESE